MNEGKEEKKPGDDLLSHRKGSTIGVEGLNFRVRNGNGCGPFTIITRQYSQKKRGFMNALKAFMYEIANDFIIHQGKQCIL